MSSAEHALLSALVAELPAPLRAVVEEQFENYNLVQREHDGRALNFYRVGWLLRRPVQPSRLLDMKSNEAPLVRISVAVQGEQEPLHAVLTAVSGRAFCLSLSRGIPEGSNCEFKVMHVSQSWRSNFPLAPASA